MATGGVLRHLAQMLGLATWARAILTCSGITPAFETAFQYAASGINTQNALDCFSAFPLKKVEGFFFLIGEDSALIFITCVQSLDFIKGEDGAVNEEGVWLATIQRMLP
jgi:hypothetical protein